MARLVPKLDLGLIDKSFPNGLLLELQAALYRTRAGDLVALTSRDPEVRDGLDRWARLTQNSIVEISEEPSGTRYIVRNGPPPRDSGPALGERLWLYTNFDCNLACDYCCVRSSPKVARRALDFETIRQVAEQAPPLGVREILLTGGEPLLLPDIADKIAICARRAPTTVLTNAALLRGKRLRELDALDRGRVCFQVSLDSATPADHEAHRGAGTHEQALRGIRAARSAGFRVRLAATVESDEQARAFEAFLDREEIAAEDRVIRPVALRGGAEAGVALARADLLPEITITASGVYWHPVGADDRDLFVSDEILPLGTAFEAVRRALENETALEKRLLTIFHCA